MPSRSRPSRITLEELLASGVVLSGGLGDLARRRCRSKLIRCDQPDALTRPPDPARPADRVPGLLPGSRHDLRAGARQLPRARPAGVRGHGRRLQGRTHPPAQAGRHQGASRFAPPGPRTLQRFSREIRAVARLRHPNVVAALDVGETAGPSVHAADRALLRDGIRAGARPRKPGDRQGAAAR